MKRKILCCLMVLLIALTVFPTSACASGSALLSEGFEEDGTPSGWLNLDKDGDGYTWYRYYPVGTAHSGNSSFASDSWTLGNPLTPDNWLITPKITLNGNCILKYYIAAQDNAMPGEHYAVLLSTTDTEYASFTTTIGEETLQSDEWLERTVNLSAYIGKEVYIAFRHYNCTNQFILKLDDVTVLLYNAQVPVLAKNDSAEELTYKNGATIPPLSVEASVLDGGKLTYQWYSNNKKSVAGASLIPGQTTNEFTPPSDKDGEKYYYCVVTNTNDAAENATQASMTGPIIRVVIGNFAPNTGENAQVLLMLILFSSSALILIYFISRKQAKHIQ